MTNPESKTVELEVVKPEDEKLIKYAGQAGLEKAPTESLVEVFRPIFAKSRAAIQDAFGVAESVKDATCVKEIRKSRACRLALRAVRLESDAARKKQKEHALLYGRAVDGFHNILMADLSPVETALQEAEDIAERAEATRLAELKTTREKELQPHLETPILGDLSQISEQDYTKMLSDAKLLKQAKIDAAAKAEAEAKAKAESDRVERERIAAENAKLKAEAIELEKTQKSEREAAEAKLAQERAAAEAAAKAAAKKSKEEREAVESKARAEKEAAEAAAKKEQARLEALAEAERKKVAAAESEAKALRDAEAKKVADAAAAAKKAAAAPDKAKLNVFSGDLRDMARLNLSDESLSDAIWTKVNVLADWIQQQAERL
jgi:hypothetical protein